MTKNNINRALEEEASPQEYTITKSLKLETVNEGSNEDDVLVRGNDNTVKYVSQSSLGGGGSQNLKQVLESGNTSVGDIPIILTTDSSDDEIKWTNRVEPNVIEIKREITASGLERTIYVDSESGFSYGDQTTEKYSGLNTEFLSIGDAEYNTTYGNQAIQTENLKTGSKFIVRIPEVLGTEVAHTATFQDKDGKVALLSDITLQKVLDNDNTADENINLVGSFYRIFSGVNGDISANYNLGSIDYNSSATQKTELRFSDRIANGSISYDFDPNKTSGTYKIATTDEVILQKIVDNGPFAVRPDNENSFVVLLDGNYISFSTADNQAPLTELASMFTQEPSSIYINSRKVSTGGYAQFEAGEGKVRIFENIGLGEDVKTTILDFETPIADASSITNGAKIKIPAKPAGEYVIATKDDISLQKIVDSGQSSASVDSGRSTFDLFTGDADERSFAVYLTSSTDSVNDYETGLSMEKNAFQLTKQFEGKRSSIYLDGGTLRFGLNSDIVDGTYSKGYTVIFPELNAESTFVNLPTPELSGTYTLSTFTVYSNPTVSPISLSELNTNYPLARSGDKVHALSVAGGALIYEKTASNWVQYSVTAVTP